MSKITQVIPNQNFEVIRNQIAVVLLDELQEQFNLSGDPLLNFDKIWLERFIPFDKSELPAINVMYTDSGFDAQEPHNSHGDSTYSIVVTLNAKHSAAGRADVVSRKNVEKIAGKLRYILEYPGYLTLGLTPGFIERTWVQDIRVGTQSSEGDALHTAAAQVLFKVRHIEENGDISPVDLLNVDSRVKLGETESGGIFIQLNNS